MQLLNLLAESRKKSALALKDPATRGLWTALVDKYSDEAHFVLELIQNADDALATKCNFFVAEDYVEFTHNGKEKFTITDPQTEHEGKIGHLNAITSIAASSKEESNKIGKFGIGFKSVFAYTDRPHIEDSCISVDLIDFIVPTPAPRIKQISDETVFFLPLKEPTKRVEIISKLQSLQTPLLFLNNLQSISWTSSDGLLGGYAKEETLIDFCFSRPNIVCSLVRTDNEVFHMFKGENATLCVPKKKIKSLSNKKNLFCFFPIQQISQLPYILHAPFLLTNNREALKENDTWNEQLISELAELQIHAVEFLGNEMLDLLPLEKGAFFTSKNIPKNPFSIFYTVARRLVENSAIYRFCGTNYHLNQINVFDDADIPLLIPDVPCPYIVVRCRSLIRAIESCKKRVVHFAECLENLSIEDYQRMGEAWCVSIYEKLSKDDIRVDANRLCILTNNGFAPVNRGGRIAISIDEVSDRLTSNASILRYLTDTLGIPQSGDVEFEINNVVSFFECVEDYSLVNKYLGKLAKCYYDLGFDFQRKQQLAMQFADLQFVPTGNQTLRRSRECVVETETTIEYYRQTDVPMLKKQIIIDAIKPEHREAFYNFLSATGCESSIIIESRQVAVDEVLMHEINLQASKRDVMTDKVILGFSELLRQTTVERSLAFSKLLSNYIEKHSALHLDQQIEGEVLHYEPQKRIPQKIKTKSTTAHKQLFNEKWLFNSAGKLVSPQEIESNLDLNEAYDALPLSFFIYFNIRVEKREEDVLKLLHEAGISDEELKEIARNVRNGKRIVFE